MLQMNAFLSFGVYVSGQGVGRQILATAVRRPKVLQMNAFLSFGDAFLGGASAARSWPWLLCPDPALLVPQHGVLLLGGPEMNPPASLPEHRILEGTDGVLRSGGPEINPPASPSGPCFLANQHVILAKSGPGINPPTQSEQRPG